MKKNLLFVILLILSLFGCKKDSNLLLDKSASLPAQEKLMSTGPMNNRYGLNNWMGSMGDQTEINNLSIPGTHDAGARIEYVWGTAKCQDLSIYDQLNVGVRFLDIRCRHIGNAFTIHHGEVYQKLNFQDVLNVCYDFLNRNPSETIIMSVKEEHTPASNNRSFEQTFDSYVKANPDKWNLEQSAGILGKLRGKIKLMRRFGAQSIKGIDATRWWDNTTFDIQNYEGYMKVQDNYRVTNLNTKADQVRSHLFEARYYKANILYVNFTSGYKSRWLFGIPDITSVSNHMNPMLSGYLNANRQGRYGIIATDFINEGLSRQIVNSNF